MNFTEYLKRQALTNQTIASVEKTVKRFLQWVERENLQPQQVRYQDMLLWMKHCQQRGTSQRSIQHDLCLIKHYYNYQQEQKNMDHNPLTPIKIQGVKRKILYPVLKPQELQTLYNHYPENTLAEKRDKVMLGLLIYQGLAVEELSRLQVSDVNLKAGQIQLPASRTSNARTLKIAPVQFMHLHEYISQTRIAILSISKIETTQLIIGKRSNRSINNLLYELLCKLRARHKNLINAQQIRASVIVKWLKQYNLREVQYLAGHRYISSTEAYQQHQMEELSESVNRYHPLG